VKPTGGKVLPGTRKAPKGDRQPGRTPGSEGLGSAALGGVGSLVGEIGGSVASQVALAAMMNAIAPTSPNDPFYNALQDPYNTSGDPGYNPYLDSRNPVYNRLSDPTIPNYNPINDPFNTNGYSDYNPYADPNNPRYDPAQDPYNTTDDPDYNPFIDPSNPYYNPEDDPDNPEYSPGSSDPVGYFVRGIASFPNTKDEWVAFLEL